MPAFLSTLRSLLAVLFLALAAVRPAAATEWTDMWWNSAQSGWGVNFVQSDNFIFATFFVYGQDQQPTWYTGQMQLDSSSGNWSGDLFRTTGAYFGGSWIPGQFTINKVGSVKFAPTNSYSGTLTYNVGTANVTQSITRQTLTTIPLGGNYAGAYVSVFSNCNDASQNGPATFWVSVSVSQTAGGNLQLVFGPPNSSVSACTQQGTYVQNGQLYRIPGASYTCGSTFASTANVTQVKATAQGIEWQWTSLLGQQYPGCVETGYMSAVLQ